MAFIRSYSRRYLMADAGDPGFGRFFKKVGRGVKRLGKGALRVARVAAPFVPGVGGIFGRLASIGARYGLSAQQVHDFATARGFNLAALDQGDIWDIGDPGGRTPKRKRAASGGKAKSQSKKERKASRTGKVGTGRKPSGSKRGIDLAKIGASATSLLPVGRDLADELGRQFGVPGFDGAAGAAAGGGGDYPRIVHVAAYDRLIEHKPRMNPANTHALRRSLRRVEGFERLAKRVMGHKLFRRVRGSVHARGRGHKAGCGCVVCRRAA